MEHEPVKYKGYEIHFFGKYEYHVYDPNGEILVLTFVSIEQAKKAIDKYAV